MAVAPLWVADRATIARELRLSGVPTTSDAYVLIDQAIEQARTRIYMRLGANRVAQITAITYVENPTSEPDMLRVMGRQLEIKLVHALLLDMLPVLFLDPSSGGAQQEYNEVDGGFRRMPSTDRDPLRTRLMSEVEIMFRYLDGSVKLGNASDNSVFTQAKPCPLPRPGGSPWVRNRHGDGEGVVPGSFDGNFGPPYRHLDEPAGE